MNHLTKIAGAVVMLPTVAWAQWAVIDAANLQQSIVNYAALTQQLTNQATQITNQIHQIEHLDTQLSRMGDMAAFKHLIGFPEFRIDLRIPSKIESWAEMLDHIDGAGLFGDTRGGLFPGISSEYPDFDGAVVEREPEMYKNAHDTIAAVDDFKSVQDDVYARRVELKQAIAETSDALQAADTEAEQQKLAAVLNAQYGQLASIDGEVAMSAAQVEVKAAETTVMTSAQSEADAEARRRLAHEETGKATTTFVPQYECLLQYVRERPLEP